MTDSEGITESGELARLMYQYTV